MNDKRKVMDILLEEQNDKLWRLAIEGRASQRLRLDKDAGLKQQAEMMLAKAQMAIKITKQILEVVQDEQEALELEDNMEEKND